MFFVDKIQTFVNLGHEIATRFLGKPYIHFRPLSTGPVLVNVNMINTLNLAFDIDARFSFDKPIGYKSDYYHALLDLTTVQIGDYFHDYDGRTFFIANFEAMKPASMVRCDSLVTIYRPDTNNGYGGNTARQPTLTGWPCSIIFSAKGETNVAQLPETVKTPGVSIHIPYFPGLYIEYGDLIQDANGRRYIVSDNDLNHLGWALTCSSENV